jgi:hypothetical protein
MNSRIKWSVGTSKVENAFFNPIVANLSSLYLQVFKKISPKNWVGYTLIFQFFQCCLHHAFIDFHRRHFEFAWFQVVSRCFHFVFPIILHEPRMEIRWNCWLTLVSKQLISGLDLFYKELKQSLFHTPVKMAFFFQCFYIVNFYW